MQTAGNILQMQPALHYLYAGGEAIVADIHGAQISWINAGILIM